MRQQLAAVFAALISGCVAMAPATDADRTFEAVHATPGLSQDQIYNGTRQWIAQNFRSAKAVIEYDNKEEGTIIGNGSMPFPCNGIGCLAKSDWTVSFTMRMDTKAERFKLSYSNLSLSWPAKHGVKAAYNGDIPTKGDVEIVRARLLLLGNDLATSLQTEPKGGDW